MQAVRREKRIGAVACRLTRETELNVSYVLCIAKQGAIGSTRSFGGTYSRAARFDEARHLLIMLLRNIGQTHSRAAEAG